MATSETAHPVLPWRIKLFISLMGVANDVCLQKNGQVNRRLLRLLDVTSPANNRPVNGVSTDDFTVDSPTGLWLRIFTPVGILLEEKLPVIVFLHGGGFIVFGANSKDYDSLCRRFSSRLRAFIVSVNYRLSPESRFPTAYDDAEAAIRWISEPGRLPESADLCRCFLAGDSAGGNIVHHVGSRIAAASTAFQPVRIAGHIMIQPFFGGEERLPSEIRLKDAPIATLERSDFSWRAFLPEGADRDHPAANVLGPRAPLLAEIGLPASLIVVGGFDPLQDRQRLYYEALKEAGVPVKLVEYPKAIHAFYIFPAFPESNELLAEMKAFMEEHGREG